MNCSREARTRWKGKKAAETARGDPISVIYEAMKDWEAPCGLFADSGVLLQVDGRQAQLLSRACFGRFYPPLAVQPASSASTCRFRLMSITFPSNSHTCVQVCSRNAITETVLSTLQSNEYFFLPCKDIDAGCCASKISFYAFVSQEDETGITIRPVCPEDPPPVPQEGMQLIQLGLEEAFFLNYELNCIEIYSQTPNGRIKLDHADLWRLMERSKKQFAHYYKAYSHLRSKRWVVLSGIQYGADFMAYRHHPALVHSDYAVLVMVGEKKQERLSTWTDLHSMQRLCGSVAKTLLLLHVTPEDAKVEAKFPICLDVYNVEAVEVERWIPEKHREDVGLEEKTS